MSLGQDHGGNRREILERYAPPRILDFSASINPLGHPKGLRKRIFECWGEVLHYPDRRAAELTSALTRTYGLPASSLLVGNGSAELLDLLVRSLRPKRLVLSPPDFGLYEQLAPEGVALVRVPRRKAEGFAPNLSELLRNVEPGDLLLLSNPGNPAGQLTPRRELEALWQRCEEVGAFFTVDEAFADFCPSETLLHDAPDSGALIVLRSLTKFFGIPGLRLGFLVGAPERAAAASKLQVPWSVNAIAQAAGAFCLADEEWPRRTLDIVARERGFLRERLARLPGFRPYPSCANYLLVELSSPAPKAAVLYERLARMGILVRHCGSFGLGEGYLRLAVRTRKENRALLSALTAQAGVTASR
jgi:threonine-phosphate decarboxylase